MEVDATSEVQVIEELKHAFASTVRNLSSEQRRRVHDLLNPIAPNESELMAKAQTLWAQLEYVRTGQGGGEVDDAVPDLYARYCQHFAAIEDAAVRYSALVCGVYADTLSTHDRASLIRAAEYLARLRSFNTPRRGLPYPRDPDLSAS